jgi:DNA-binding transcriptional LysR family regulator
MDLLNGMRVFTRVAESGSFSAVARELGVTQPTVSKIVAQLEAHFGAQLIARSTTGLKLTDPGTELYERCKSVVDQVAEMESSVGSVHQIASGRLRVSAPTAFGETYLAPMLLKLAERLPRLEIDLILNDRWFDLLEDGIDVALRFGPLPDSRLIARKLGLSPQACLASPEYLEAHGAPDHPRDLERHRCIVNSLVAPTGRWVFSDAGAEIVAHVSGNFRTNNLGAIRHAVLAGNGIAIGPVWLYYEDLRTGRVRLLLEKFDPAPLEINALYVANAFRPAKVKVFIDTLEQEIRLAPGLAHTLLPPAAAGMRPRPESRAIQPAPAARSTPD